MIIIKVFIYAIGFAIGIFLGGFIWFGLIAIMKLCLLKDVPEEKEWIPKYEDEDWSNVKSEEAEYFGQKN